jgi:hypothetical protein
MQGENEKASSQGELIHTRYDHVFEKGINEKGRAAAVNEGHESDDTGMTGESGDGEDNLLLEIETKLRAQVQSTESNEHKHKRLETT